jgi:hypothetical protein
VARGLFLDAAAGMADYDGRPLDGELAIRGVEMAGEIQAASAKRGASAVSAKVAGVRMMKRVSVCRMRRRK